MHSDQSLNQSLLNPIHGVLAAIRALVFACVGLGEVVCEVVTVRAPAHVRFRGLLILVVCERVIVFEYLCVS